MLCELDNTGHSLTQFERIIIIFIIIIIISGHSTENKLLRLQRTTEARERHVEVNYCKTGTMQRMPISLLLLANLINEVEPNWQSL